MDNKNNTKHGRRTFIKKMSKVLGLVATYGFIEYPCDASFIYCNNINNDRDDCSWYNCAYYCLALGCQMEQCDCLGGCANACTGHCGSRVSNSRCLCANEDKASEGYHQFIDKTRVTSVDYGTTQYSQLQSEAIGDPALNLHTAQALWRFAEVDANAELIEFINSCK